MKIAEVSDLKINVKVWKWQKGVLMICFIIFLKDHSISSICTIYYYIVLIYEKLIWLLSFILITLFSFSKNQDWLLMSKKKDLNWSRWMAWQDFKFFCCNLLLCFEAWIVIDCE